MNYTHLRYVKEKNHIVAKQIEEAAGIGEKTD